MATSTLPQNLHLFLERGLHILMNERFIFSGGFNGGGTPIMPLPTRTNLGLCCNRIKKKHELQYTPENLQEQYLNFTRKGTSSQITFRNIS